MLHTSYSWSEGAWSMQTASFVSEVEGLDQNQMSAWIKSQPKHLTFHCGGNIWNSEDPQAELPSWHSWIVSYLPIFIWNNAIISQIPITCPYLKSEKLAKDSCHREDVIVLCPHPFLCFVKFYKTRTCFVILLLEYVALAKIRGAVAQRWFPGVRGSKLEVMGLQFEMLSSWQILCGGNKNGH